MILNKCRCGGEPFRVVDYEAPKERQRYVECWDCETQGTASATQEGACENWNNETS